MSNGVGRRTHRVVEHGCLRLALALLAEVKILEHSGRLHANLSCLSPFLRENSARGAGEGGH